VTKTFWRELLNPAVYLGLTAITVMMVPVAIYFYCTEKQR
jgi:hypothetical protein